MSPTLSQCLLAVNFLTPLHFVFQPQPHPMLFMTFAEFQLQKYLHRNTFIVAGVTIRIASTATEKLQPAWPAH